MSRACSICHHENREEIERALLKRESFRHLSKRFRVSTSSLFRHRGDHLSRTLVKAKEFEELEHGQDLLEQMRDLNRRTLRILDQAEASGDLRTALAAIREVRGNQELVGRLLGELDAFSPPTATINIDKLDRLAIALFGPHRTQSIQGAVDSKKPQAAIPSWDEV